MATKTFKEFMEDLTEWSAEEMIARHKAMGKPQKPGREIVTQGNVTRVRHTAPEGKDEPETAGEEKKEKRGRGRPSGSKSGARTKGDDGGMAGTDDYHLALPTKSVYFK